MPADLTNTLRRERGRRSLSQERMAELAGISRQSYAAIESGTSVPSTAVALRLARALGLGVEDLFGLPDDAPDSIVVESAMDVGHLPVPVRVARVGGRWVGMPARDAAGSFGPADGLGRMVSATEMRVSLFADRPPPLDLVTVGCDPSFPLVSAALRRDAGVEACSVASGSRVALEALARGHAHVAGVHLLDPQTGEYNKRWIQEVVPFDCVRVRYARWEQGLVVGPGNPCGIGGIGDLVRPGVRFLNREPGSGTRVLLDTLLEAGGVPIELIDGYHGLTASGHLAVAQAVATGLVDAGVGIRAAGLALGVETLPLAEEEYDLVIPAHHLDVPAVRALLDLLRTRSVRRQVEALGGYDVAGMGLEAE